MLLWLIFLQWPLIGIGVVIWGISSLRRREFTKRAQHVRWSKLLDAWKLSLPESERSLAVQDIQRGWNTLISWALIGLGVAMTLVGLLRILQVLLTTGSHLSATTLIEQPALEIELVSVLIGYSIGYLAGLWQLRKRSFDRLAYADLRPKRLTDYHSLAMQSIPIGTIIYNCILLLVSMPYWREHIVIDMINGTQMVLPGWITWIVPCLGIVLIVIAERFLWLVATFPRLLINLNLPLAARVDDMLRSLVSTSILALEYGMIGMLNYTLASFLALNARTPDYVWYMLLVSLLLPYVLVLVGMMLGVFKGRIGGKLNGWAWHSGKLREQELIGFEQTIVEKQ